MAVPPVTPPSDMRAVYEGAPLRRVLCEGAPLEEEALIARAAVAAQAAVSADPPLLPPLWFLAEVPMDGAG